MAHVPVLAAVLNAMWFYRKLGTALKAISLFIFLSGAIQFISLYFYFHMMNNLPLLHIYAAGGFVCLARFYRVVLGSHINPMAIWIAATLFVLFCVANTLFLQSIFIFNSYALISEAVLVIILSLFTFLYFLNDSIRGSDMQDMKSISWINSGLFIYFLSSFLIYYFSNIMIVSFTLGLRRSAWLFHAFFSTVMYSCFLIGLWKRSKIKG